MESWRMGNGHEGPGSGVRSEESRETVSFRRGFSCLKATGGRLASSIMKQLAFVCLVLAKIAWAGESALTVTYQPLDGLGSGEVQICGVVCHDWYSHSGQPTALGLISARNVPPTNNPKEATGDLNLASVCGISFSCGDIDQVQELFFDASQFKSPDGRGYDREVIVRASLECLRRCLPDKLVKTPVQLKASDTDKVWLSSLVNEFNKHDRSKVFYEPPQ